MKAIPSALQDHLDSGATTLAWCWRIERTDGLVLGFTDHDRELVFGGLAYEPDSGLTASDLRASNDLSVDAQDAEGALRSDRITETDILAGLWDSAEVQVWRVNWQDPAQRVLLRRGTLGEVRRGRVAFTTEVRSLAHVLSQTVGRTFQALCDAELGDARCKVDLSGPAFNGGGLVVSIDRDRAFVADGIGSFPDNWFAFGSLEWTSGANAGRRAEVEASRAVPGGVLVTLLEVPVKPVAASDAFTIRAGCDKVASTCAAKFSNITNFRGFPHIPGQDVLIRYAAPGSGAYGRPL